MEKEETRRHDEKEHRTNAHFEELEGQLEEINTCQEELEKELIDGREEMAELKQRKRMLYKEMNEIKKHYAQQQENAKRIELEGMIMHRKKLEETIHHLSSQDNPDAIRKAEMLEKELHKLNEKLEDIECHKHEEHMKMRHTRIDQIRKELQALEKQSIALDEKAEMLERKLDEGFEKIEIKREGLMRELDRLEEGEETEHE